MGGTPQQTGLWSDTEAADILQLSWGLKALGFTKEKHVWQFNAYVFPPE